MPYFCPSKVIIPGDNPRCCCSNISCKAPRVYSSISEVAVSKTLLTVWICSLSLVNEFRSICVSCQFCHGVLKGEDITLIWLFLEWTRYTLGNSVHLYYFLWVSKCSLRNICCFLWSVKTSFETSLISRKRRDFSAVLLKVLATWIDTDDPFISCKFDPFSAFH